ncbi:MAG: DUF2177 family protein [Phenylobacterium sp.]|nr:DUF2177 family protein [Phenylobacterium sp.]
MIRWIATYLAIGVAFAAVDAIWLTQVGPGLYRPTLDPVLRSTDDPLNLPAAVVFYLVYILGVLVLAVRPNFDKPLIQTTITGGLLGALCYATYDLTNQATLKVWSTQITVMDIGWGTVLTASCATVGGWVWRRLGR